MINYYSYVMISKCNLLNVAGQKSTALTSKRYYSKYLMKLWRYLLIYGVDVYPINPRPKISLQHRGVFSSRVKRHLSDLECSANYLILRVSLASALAPGKIALGSFYVLGWRRLGHFTTMYLPDGKK